MIFVIDRRESRLRYQAGCLKLQRKGKRDQYIPVRQLDQVVVYGNPLVEAAALRVLSEAGVPVVMLAARGKPQVAMLGSGLATQLPFRRRQHRLAGDSLTRLAMAKWFVQAKMESYDLPLKTMEAMYDAKTSDCNEFITLRNESMEKLLSATSISSITGLEGQLAHAWFALLARYLPYLWKFAGRNRRPPRDPVNGLLSLGYTLLLSEVRRGILVSGLDPSLGFLHQDYPGRESLALDVTEIFRAGVDDFTLKWLKQSDLDNDSFFYRKKEGCRMIKKVRPLFFQAWAHVRENWPRPRNDPNNDQNDQQTSLRESINGQIMQIKQAMKSLEGYHDKINTRKGHGAGSVERKLAPVAQ